MDILQTKPSRELRSLYQRTRRRPLTAASDTICDVDEHIVIQHWQRADGDLTLERLRSKMSYGGWTVSAYTHAPGTILARHVHQGDKKDGVLTGSVVVSDGTHDYELGPGDVALIPAGVAPFLHRVPGRQRRLPGSDQPGLCRVRLRHDHT